MAESCGLACSGADSRMLDRYRDGNGKHIRQSYSVASFENRCKSFKNVF